MTSSMRMSCSIGRPSLARAPSARAQRPRLNAPRRHVTKAKYGDESIYFDLEDIEQTTGQWEMYAADEQKRYPEQQSEFFERAAKPLTKRESLLAVAAIGGTLSTLLWGFSTPRLDLPINKGPSKPPGKGPRGKI